MELLLQRHPSQYETTIGDLFIDDQRFCVTLEDEIRVDDPSTPSNEGAKVYGKTAIPPGRYEVTINFSPKFQKMMLAVLDVPGFTGIRIHSGNDAEDTLGCILVGLAEDSATRIHGGSVALPTLFKLVQEALDRLQPVHITVCNPAPTSTQTAV